jgi:Skp family chaperone for outer membrane proteins
MKNLLTIAFSIIFLAVSAIAQTQTVSLKIVFMNTNAFYDEKQGITKLVNANKQLNNEFAARIKDLDDGSRRLDGIAKEMETMQKLPPAQFNRAAYTTKQDEGERLQRELQYKKTELETAISKRRVALVGPISREIGDAVTEFSKKNSYGVVFDVAKLDNSGALLFLADAADVTKDFIAFYNARPAGATVSPTTTTPRPTATPTPKPPVKP